MAVGDRSSPARCLFTDVANSPNVSNKISHELEALLLGEVRRFQQRYDFDLLTMQPLGSTPSLSGVHTGRSVGEDSMTTADATPRGVHLRWSWEALDPRQQYVPRFYHRITYPVSVVSSRNSSVENIPPTPVKSGERGTRPREGEKTLPSGCDCVESPKMPSFGSRQTSVLAYFSRICKSAAAKVATCDANKNQPTPSEPEGPPAPQTAGRLYKSQATPACRRRSKSLPPPPPPPPVKSRATGGRSTRELSRR
ncbi:hypothetical protein AAHC03_016475 [Spirometra sp. Aus1]